MQLMIDTAQDQGYHLIVAITALAAAVRLEAVENGSNLDTVDRMLEVAVSGPRAPRPAQTPTPPPIGTPAPVHAPAIPLPPGNQPVAPVEHPPVHPDAEKDVPTGTEEQPVDLLPPSAIFGGALPLSSTQDVSGAYATPGSVPPAPLAASPAMTTPDTGTTNAPFVPAPPVAAAPSAAFAPTVTAGGVPPVPVAAPAPPMASAVELDKKGFPWDARIHSETKKKNADGTWRNRRNLDDAVKAEVIAELTAARGGAASAAGFQPHAVVPGAVPVPAPPAPVPVQPVAAVAVPAPPVPAAGNVPAPPAPGGGTNVVPFPNQATAAAPVPVPPAPGVGMPNAGLPEVVSSFRELIQLVNLALSKGTMKPEQMNEACAYAKVDSITGLASQPLLIPDVYKYMLSRNWLVSAA